MTIRTAIGRRMKTSAKDPDAVIRWKPTKAQKEIMDEIVFADAFESAPDTKFTRLDFAQSLAERMGLE